MLIRNAEQTKGKSNGVTLYFIRDCFEFYNFISLKGATATRNDKNVCIISG